MSAPASAIRISSRCPIAPATTPVSRSMARTAAIGPACGLTPAAKTSARSAGCAGNFSQWVCKELAPHAAVIGGMRATLFHNPTAGKKGHGKDDILAALKLAGHTARYVSTKSDKFKSELDKVS